MSDQIPLCVEMGDSVLYQKIQDEVVLLNMDNQHYYGLNAIGADMWDSLIQYRDVSVAAENLSGIYDAESESLQRDVRSFVRDLLDAGLLKAGTSQSN